MAKIYKVLNTKTGEFYTKRSYSCSHGWGKTGSVWQSRRALTLSIREGALHKVAQDPAVVVVEYEVVETETVREPIKGWKNKS